MKLVVEHNTTSGCNL